VKANIGSIVPCILNLGTRCRSVVSFMPQPTYSGTCWRGARVVLDALEEIRPWYFGSQPVTILTELGRAIAEAVSRCLPTAAARVRARIWSCGVCDGQSGTVADFLRILRFRMPIFIRPHSPSSQSHRADTTGQEWPTCRVDPIWISPPTMRIKKHLIWYVLFAYGN
jgi:hypothetical protein